MNNCHPPLPPPPPRTKNDSPITINNNVVETSSPTPTVLWIPSKEEGPDHSIQERVIQAMRGESGSGGDTTPPPTTTTSTNDNDNDNDNNNNNNNNNNNINVSLMDITCQVKIDLIPTMTTSNNNSNNDVDYCWILTSFDHQGNRKTKGGDEFYIQYIEYEENEDDEDQEESSLLLVVQKSPNNNNNKNNNDRKIQLSAVAIIEDLHNGTYQLHFSTTPLYPNVPPPLSGFSSSSSSSSASTTNPPSSPPMGTLTIYFEYSNGIGQIPPPYKNHWFNGGYSHTKFVIQHVPRPSTIRQFQPPISIPISKILPSTSSSSTTSTSSLSTTTSSSNNIISRASPSSSSSSSSPNCFLNMYDRILVFGDSSYCQLIRQRPNRKGKYYFQSNLEFVEKIRIGLNSTTIIELVQLLEEHHGTTLRQATPIPTTTTTTTTGISKDSTSSSSSNSNSNSNSNPKPQQRTALIVGSCLWDLLDSHDTLQGSTYEDHKRAIHDYLTAIQTSYPNVQIIWKSPTAVHIHVVDLNRLVIDTTTPPTKNNNNTNNTKTTTIQNNKNTSTSNANNPNLSPTLFGIDRIRYMSASRSKFLYELQKNVIHEFSTTTTNSTNNRVQWMDLYEATYLSADQLYPSDGRHYRPNLNRLMLSWFYQGDR